MAGAAECLSSKNEALSSVYQKEKKKKRAGCSRLTHIILATWEAEIRRIVIRDQPLANSSQDSYPEKTHHTKRTGGEALTSNPNAAKKKKKERETPFI
jgi:hypothetical protein